MLDLTRLLPGAVCTLMLAELGAQIIKIEAPEGGDYARWMGVQHQGMGAYFRATNRGKRSVVINLKDERGQKALHRLAAWADVLVESFRPGVLAKMSADYETLRKVNPALVYCSLSGWGQDGAYAQRSGHDLNYVALAGLIGEMNVPQPLGGQVADVGGAYAAVAGILAALFRRERTGAGALIDTALAEAALPMIGWAWVEAVYEGRGVAAERGILSGRYACYNVYRAGDGRPVALAALEPKFWANFCKAVGREDWLPLHVQPEQQAALRAELEALFVQRPAAAWSALLEPADCCFSLVNTPSDLLSDAHFAARGAVFVGEDGLPTFRSPIRLDTAVELGGAPAFGADTAAVLEEAGFSETEIAALQADGVIR